MSPDSGIESYLGMCYIQPILFSQANHIGNITEPTKGRVQDIRIKLAHSDC